METPLPSALEPSPRDPGGENAVRRIHASRKLEALDLGARLSGILPLLTRTLRLMASLAETVHDDHAFFVNERTRLGIGRGRSAGGIVPIACKVIVWILFARRITRA